MDLMDTFKMLDHHRPFIDTTEYDPNKHEPQYVEPQNVSTMEQQFALFQTTQPLYNVDGYISPFPTNNWDTTTTLGAFINDDSRLPALEPKLDPNKIFSSDIAALRTLAADQGRITKMFERRLIESLTDKSKFGLTEEDVEAMQALTSARSAITAINKEQINIKKNIAELKIKQMQNKGVPGMSDAPVGMGGGGSSVDVARSVMDNIFNLPQAPTVSSYQATEVSLEQAERVIDGIISTESISDEIKYENMNPKTYVVLDGENSSHFETFADYGAGQIIDNYPIPQVRITSYDLNNFKAYDDNGVEYDIKRD